MDNIPINQHLRNMSIMLQMLMYPFEAESVAYSVAAYLNLDTSDYTFEYLSSWSISNDTENLKNQMDSIRTGVIDILDALNDSKLMSDVA